MSVDILFISPPMVNFDSKKKPKLLMNTSFFAPIGPPYLSAYLEQHGFKTVIIDMEAEKYGISKIPEIVEKIRPRIIGINIVAEALYIISLQIIKKIRETIETPIIIGGILPTNNPDLFLKKSDINFIVRGEGEQTLLDLTRFLLLKEGELKDIRGISYNENGQIIHNPDREFFKNLDELPFPSWEKLPINKYFIIVSYYKTSFGMIASRGCPYRCIFCIDVFNFHRFRSPKNVVDEIEYVIKKFKIKDITFHDPTFNVNPKWVISFCKEMISRKTKVKWRCVCRVDNINEKMIGYMKAAGCYSISFGIETSKDRFLKFLKKDFTIAQVERAVKLVKKFKIEILGYFMFGIPGQTVADLEHNIKFIKKLNLDYINITILNPPTATELRDIAIEKNWLIKKEYENYESPELIAIHKQIWRIPNLNEEVINYYIKKAFLSYLLNLRNFKNSFFRYLKKPSRLLNAIRNIIQTFF